MTDFSQRVVERYGGADPGTTVSTDHEAAGTIDLLLRHASVRSFADRPVPDEVVRTMIAAAQSASSSSHQQAWSVIEIRDPDRIRTLAATGKLSAFAAEAPMVLVFVVDWDRAAAVAAAAGEPAPAVAYLESTLVGFVDAGIAAQNAVVAAEALGLGVCYLGSLRNAPLVVADLLGLPPGTMAAFGLAVGYPASSRARALKPRLPQQVVLHHERYGGTDVAAVHDYADRMDAFYERLGRGGTSWLQTVIARVRDVAGLHGRERMREWLTRRGLPSR